MCAMLVVYTVSKSVYRRLHTIKAITARRLSRPRSRYVREQAQRPSARRARTEVRKTKRRKRRKREPDVPEVIQLPLTQLPLSKA